MMQVRASSAFTAQSVAGRRARYIKSSTIEKVTYYDADKKNLAKPMTPLYPSKTSVDDSFTYDTLKDFDLIVAVSGCALVLLAADSWVGEQVNIMHVTDLISVLQPLHTGSR